MTNSTMKIIVNYVYIINDKYFVHFVYKNRGVCMPFDSGKGELVANISLNVTFTKIYVHKYGR